MSTLKVQSVQHPSAASAAIALDANGQATLNGLAFPTSGSLSGRNRIINGAMTISQRGTSFTANGYTLDRWTVYNSGGTFTLTQQTAASGSQPENGMTNFLRISRTSPSGIFYLEQRIEDISLYDGFSVVVSFYAKANTNITLPVRLTQEFGAGGSAAVAVNAVNTSVTSSWARYTVSFTLPSLSGKTVGTGSYLSCVFDTPATYSTLDITGIQLEAGTVATPFERRSYGQELALCQRYFWKTNGLGFAVPQVSGAFISATIGRVRFNTPVSMRGTPTLSVTTGSLRGAGLTLAPSSYTVEASTGGSTYVTCAVTGASANYACELTSDNDITLSSEL